MLFYFELVRPDGSGVAEDQGVELTGLHEARDRALRALNAIAEEELDPDRAEAFVMLIRESRNGEVLITASISLAGSTPQSEFLERRH